MSDQFCERCGSKPSDDCVSPPWCNVCRWKVDTTWIEGIRNGNLDVESLGSHIYLLLLVAEAMTDVRKIVEEFNDDKVSKSLSVLADIWDRFRKYDAAVAQLKEKEDQEAIAQAKAYAYRVAARAKGQEET
jgi:hypothetical protein